MRKAILIAAGLIVTRAALAVSVMGGGGSPRTAPGIDDTPPIQWRTSYAEALKESREKGRPLIIFFHEMNKGARLAEMGTFDDPRVKTRCLRFVPVQVDVGTEADVVAKYGLRISQTVVIADPEEKKLCELPGNPNFEEVSKAMDDCAKQLGNPPTDQELAEMASRYETAKAAFDDKRYSTAALYLKPLLEVKAACEVVRKARELASAIDSAGAAALAAAGELEKQKKWSEAVAAYAKAASDFRGSATEKAAAEARKRIQSDPTLRAAADSKKTEADAKAILDAAVRYEKAEKYSAAIASYERVVDMGETTSLARAEEALKRLRADESVMKAVKAEESAREAKSLWARANSWASSNQPAKAVPLLKELLAKYPDSEYAPRAEAKLKELESK